MRVGKKLISIRISEGFKVFQPQMSEVRSPTRFTEVGRFVECSATFSSPEPFANLGLRSLASCQLA
jgi:hypothetical protein